MKVLGIGGSAHDYAAALTVDGKIACAVEEERLARVKHSFGLLKTGRLGLATGYCLDAAGISLNDIDLLVTNSAMFGQEHFTRDRRYEVITHHLAHAASAFYPSGFDDAAILVVDALGSECPTGPETTSWAVGEGNQVRILEQVTGKRLGDGYDSFVTNSLGYYYTLATILCGFALFDEGKTMGLAPYSSGPPLDEVFRAIELLPDGRFQITEAAADLMDAAARRYVGAAADKGDQFRREARVAMSAQAALEKVLLHCARHAVRLTGKRRLCLAGGTALNSVANGRILREAGIEALFVQPAANDAGTALGAALYGEYGLGNARRGPREVESCRMSNAYTGRTYPAAEIARAIAEAGLTSVTTENPARAAARAVAEGRIVGWFCGGSEYGPRALGHRSILADPRRADMKDILNARVKHREAFRPFAPSVLLGEQGRFFVNDCPSPFMLLVCDVREEARALLPAITHVDGTARVQTVPDDDNEPYSRLLKELGALTGVPVVLNTSFNDKGEPIVETPQDAIRTFLKTGMDVLVMEDFVVSRGGW